MAEQIILTFDSHKAAIKALAMLDDTFCEFTEAFETEVKKVEDDDS